MIVREVQVTRSQSCWLWEPEANICPPESWGDNWL